MSDSREGPVGPSSGGVAGAVGWLLCVVVSIVGCAGVLGWLLMPSLSHPKWIAERSTSRQNLKQIGLALHGYHDVHTIFPMSGTFDAQGLGHHSWQTRLLPWLELQNVYESVDFDKPWNDPANAPVFRTVIPVLQNPRHQSRIGSKHGFAESGYAGNSLVLRPNESLFLQQIKDGVSITLLAGEVSTGFKPWGDPTNVRDPSAGLNGEVDGYGGTKESGPQMLFCDGSVRTFNPKIDPAVLKALTTPDGGETVDTDDWGQ